VWKIGPEWAAQQRKKTPARTMNCGVLSADHAALPAGFLAVGALAAAGAGASVRSVGARRMRNVAGTITATAPMAIQSMALRQP
jgi:hypothetical protein